MTCHHKRQKIAISVKESAESPFLAPTHRQNIREILEMIIQMPRTQFISVSSGWEC
jgi:hypothetical protein